MGRISLRSLCRFALLGLSAVVVLAVPSPARADVTECSQAWGRVASLVRDESHQGMTAELLDELNRLIPILVECSDWDTDGDGWLTGVDRWGPLVATYFQPEDVKRVLCLMGYESGGNPWAQNPTSGATGLMQIMPFWAAHFGQSVSDLFNPAFNLQVASLILEQQGWSAWNPYQRGLCH